jgi:hypothetical protein
MDEIIIQIEDNQIQKSEKYMKYIIRTTIIPCFRSNNKYIKYSSYTIINIILLGSIFSMLWYPNYYLNQPLVWTLDLVMVLITINYLFYLLHFDTDLNNSKETYEVVQWKKNITLIFYCIFMIYWFYFAVIAFNYHNQQNALIQLGNIYMSFSWYLYFSTVSLIYYYICNRLLKRSVQIRGWLKSLKKKYKNQCIELKDNDNDFYNEYDSHHSIIKKFSKYWNFLIFLGFILLLGHIPIDLISIIFNKHLFEIPSVVIKSSALIWYLYCICQLNDYEDKIVPYLYKHRIYTDNQIEHINKYIQNRPLGLNFYGIKISGTFIIKYLIIGINLLVPFLYTIFSKNMNIE